MKGWFKDTLPEFLRTFTLRNRLVIHMDADLYSSTLFSLIQLDQIIDGDTILIFDEFGDIDHEFAAFREYIKACNRKWVMIGARKKFDKAVIKIL